MSKFSLSFNLDVSYPSYGTHERARRRIYPNQDQLTFKKFKKQNKNTKLLVYTREIYKAPQIKYLRLKTLLRL